MMIDYSKLRDIVHFLSFKCLQCIQRNLPLCDYYIYVIFSEHYLNLCSENYMYILYS